MTDNYRRSTLTRITRLRQIPLASFLKCTLLLFECHTLFLIYTPRTIAITIHGKCITYQIWSHFQRLRVHGRISLVCQNQQLLPLLGRQNRPMSSLFPSRPWIVLSLNVRVYHPCIYASVIYLLFQPSQFRNTHCARSSSARERLGMLSVARNVRRRMPGACKMSCSLEPY